jgi:hypothetical protein
MREAYGVEIPPPRATLHGPYAEAIEALALGRGLVLVVPVAPLA